MLKLAAIIATLVNLNLRVERVGKERTRPSADLKFSADVPNTMLDQIHPGLLNSLYRRPDEKHHQADLTAPDPDTLTTPRYPHAKPWASTEDWPGYHAAVAVGEFDPKRVEIPMVTLKGITAEAKNGGTVTLTFSLGGYPTGDDVGQLYDLIGKAVTLDLDPPAIGDLERLRAEEKARKAAGSAPPPPPADPGDEPPATNAQIGRAFPDAIDARGDNPPSARRGKAKPEFGTKDGAAVH